MSNSGNRCGDASDQDRAIASCTSLIEFGQETLEKLALAYSNRGYYLSNKHQYDRAIPDLDQAIRLDPQNVLALVNRAHAHTGAEQYDHALADLERAIEIDPSYAPAFNDRCWVRAIRGALSEALADCDGR